MKYTVEKKDKLTINFKLSKDEFEKFVQGAYEHNKGKYNVPGFRKGHVPRKVLESNYGASLFYEDALFDSATEYYGEFLDNNKDIEPVARPTIDEKSIKFGDKEIEFAIIVVVRPEVTLGQYKGLTIEKTKVPAVKASEVDDELKRVQERNSRTVEVTDRAVKDGDEITLDYSGSVDGVKFDGGTAEDQKLVVGSKTFIPGFEEQLVGMNIGEEKDINVTFPEEYEKSLAGKNAVFAIKIKAISEKILPEIDDEFAKDVSDFATLKEYKEDIKKNIKEHKEKDAQIADEGKLLDAVVANAKMDIPSEMIDEEIDGYVDDLKYQAQGYGIKFEDYLKITNTTIEKLRESYKERSEKSVRTRLVFEEIVKAEKMKADEKKVAEKIKEYAEQVGQDAEKFEKSLTIEQRAYFMNQVLTLEVIEMLKKENTIA